MIELRNIHKVYAKTKKPALQNIDLHIHPGQSTVIFGENGAGKTTLLRIIAGLIKPSTGTCLINEKNTDSQSQVIKQHIGFLMGSDTGLYDRLTGYENIKYHADLRGLEPSVFENRLKKFSQMLQMQDYLHKKSCQFSFGMKQKTAIARAFIHDPDIILLDEPTTGLDITSAFTMHQFIRQAQTQNKTIIFSSHRLDEIYRLGQRVIALQQGRVFFDGSVKDFKKQKILHKIFIEQ